MADLFKQVLLSLLEATEYKIELKSGKIMTKILSDRDYQNMKSSIGTPKGIVKSVTPISKKDDSNFDDEGEFEKNQKAEVKAREKKVEDYYKQFDPNFKLKYSAEDEYGKLYPGGGNVDRFIINKYKVTPDIIDFCIISELGKLMKDKSKILTLDQVRCIQNEKDYKAEDIPKELQDRGVRIYPSEFNSIIEYTKRVRRDIDVISKVKSVFEKCVIAGAKDGIPTPLGIDKKDIQTYLRYYEMKDVNNLGKLPLYTFFLDYLKSNLK